MQRKAGRKPLPGKAKVRAFTLSAEDYVISYVNADRMLGNESKALRLILKEYARANGIEIPYPTETDKVAV